MSQQFTDFGLLILRLGFGGIMLFAHGLPKLSGFADYADKFPDPIGLGSTTSLALAVFGEFFCGIALCLGLFTRYAAIPFSITMFVAAFIQHAPDPWQKKEMAVLYLVAGVVMALTGPGKYSVDARMR